MKKARILHLLPIGIIAEEGSSLQKVIRNIIWLFSDRLIRIVASIAVGVWVARYLGPEQFGLLNYAIAFVALFNPLTNLGLDEIIIRDIVQAPAQKDIVLGTGLILKFLGGVATNILIFLVISLQSQAEPLRNYLIMILALGLLFQGLNVVDLWFQAQIQAKYTIYVKNIAFLFLAVTKIILVIQKAPLIAFAWAILGEIVLNSLGLGVTYWIQSNLTIKWKISFTKAVDLLWNSWPLILSGFSIYLYTKIDQVMLNTMVSSKSVGLYTVAVRLSETFDIIPGIICSSVLPVVLEKHQQGEAELMAYLQKIYDLMAASWLIVAIPVSLLSSWIILILYGEAYAGAAPILSLYIWSQIGSNFGAARTLYINTKNLFKISLIITIIGAIANVILNLFLIPLFQEMGATLATLITYFAVVILLNFCFKDLRQLLPIIGRSLVIHKAVLRLLKPGFPT